MGRQLLHTQYFWLYFILLIIVKNIRNALSIRLMERFFIFGYIIFLIVNHFFSKTKFALNEILRNIAKVHPIFMYVHYRDT